MEELRKCYKKLDELMKEIENRHDTDMTQTSWILLILMKK